MVRPDPVFGLVREGEEGGDGEGEEERGEAEGSNTWGQAVPSCPRN